MACGAAPGRGAFGRRARQGVPRGVAGRPGGDEGARRGVGTADCSNIDVADGKTEVGALGVAPAPWSGSVRPGWLSAPVAPAPARAETAGIACAEASAAAAAGITATAAGGGMFCAASPSLPTPLVHDRVDAEGEQTREEDRDHQPYHGDLPDFLASRPAERCGEARSAIPKLRHRGPAGTNDRMMRRIATVRYKETRDAESRAVDAGAHTGSFLSCADAAAQPGPDACWGCPIVRRGAHPPQIGSAVVPFTRSIANRPVTFRRLGTAATKRR